MQTLLKQNNLESIMGFLSADVLQKIEIVQPKNTASCMWC